MEAKLLDLSGVVCPMTWMQASRQLSRMLRGELLAIVVDEGKPAVELPRSAKAGGHLVRSVRHEGGKVRFELECLGLAAREGDCAEAEGAREGNAIEAAGGGRAMAEVNAELASLAAAPSSTPASPHAQAPLAAVDPALRRYASVADLIGSPDAPTPLVRLSRLGPVATRVYVKLEWMNPFGSIKDRTAKYLLAGLRERGVLDGKQLVEPSSGNTGIALAALANLLGVKTTITIPDAVPEEKQVLLRLLGATVWPTPDDLCPIDHPRDGAIALAHSIAAQPGYVMPNQYENPNNVRAHYETTGPEIWRQTEGRVRVFVAGYGTCGTLTGIARYLKEQDPSVRVVAIEPKPGHRLPGLKSFAESKEPSILDRSLIDETFVVDDDTAYRTAIRLAREESLLVGPSTGAIVAVALREAEARPGETIVAISPDSAFKYVSYFQDWVGRDGRPEERRAGEEELRSGA